MESEQGPLDAGDSILEPEPYDQLPYFSLPGPNPLHLKAERQIQNLYMGSVVPTYVKEREKTRETIMSVR